MKFPLVVVFHVIFTYINSYEIEDENGKMSNIIIQLCNDLGGDLYTNIRFGTPSHIKYFLLDLENSINILVTDIINASSSNKHHSTSMNILNPHEEVNLYNTQTQSIKLEDVFQLEGYPYELRLPFNFVNKTTLLFYDQISLCSSFKNESTSLVHVLYNNKIISYKKFGISLNKMNSVVLCLGGFPKEIIKSFPYKHKFNNANKQSNKWTLNLNGIIIGDVNNNSQIYVQNEIGLLSTRERFIYAPMDFFIYLNTSNVMRTMFEQNICFVQTINGVYEILCKCGFLNRLENITFVIEGHMIEMNAFKLFRSYYDKCLFQIKGYFENKNWETKWVFGNLLMKEYSMLFDYEDKTITFYSQEENFKQSKIFGSHYGNADINFHLKKMGYIIIMYMQGFLSFVIIFLLKKI